MLRAGVLALNTADHLTDVCPRERWSTIGRERTRIVFTPGSRMHEYLKWKTLSIFTDTRTRT